MVADKNSQTVRIMYFRREYGERTKTTRCRIKVMKKQVRYTICSLDKPHGSKCLYKV